MNETTGTACPAGTSRRDGTGQGSIRTLSCPGSRPDPIPVPDRTARAAAWRADEARRITIMGEHAGTAEGVRLLIQHDPDHKHADSLLAAVTR